MVPAAVAKAYKMFKTNIYLSKSLDASKVLSKFIKYIVKDLGEFLLIELSDEVSMQDLGTDKYTLPTILEQLYGKSSMYKGKSLEKYVGLNRTSIGVPTYSHEWEITLR